MLFLGTAGAAPSAHRGAPGHLVRRGGDRILVDCGEGTQRQLLRSGVGLVDVDDVLITHCHADHVLGLPGMLKTFALRARETPLCLYGPPGLGELMNVLRPVIGRLTYKVEVQQLTAGDAVERDGYRMHAFATDHRVPSVGYALVEDERPGRFDIDAARGLGVPEGPMFGLLQHGEAVTLDSGVTIRRMRSSVRPAPGARWSSRATRVRARGSSRRASAPTCSSTRRRSSRRRQTAPPRPATRPRSRPDGLRGRPE